jgi:hypothetical protein
MTKPQKTTVKIATLTGAAKDISTTVNDDGSLDLLTGNPGSAVVYSLVDPSGESAGAQFPTTSDEVGTTKGGTVRLDADGKVYYTPPNDLSVGEHTDTFVYTIRMANGALSTATASVTVTVDGGDGGGDGGGGDPKQGTVLFSDDFSTYVFPTSSTGNWLPASGANWISTWTSASGSGTPEICKENYGGTVGSTGGYILDTQGTPGPINISATVEDQSGDKAQIVIVVGTQSATRGDAVLQVQWNGIEVAKIYANTFTTGTWQTLTFDPVDSNEGYNTLTIRDITTVGTTVGFAVDAVYVYDWA